MNIVEKLNSNLLCQPFVNDTDENEMWSYFLQVAMMYANTENSIAVLSDLKANKSIIYYGALALELGICENKSEELDTIWERNIYDRIHPDDLLMRHITELRYFNLLESTPIEQRTDYHTISTIRMKTHDSRYVNIIHRTFYVHSSKSGNLSLALCLYSYCYDDSAHPNSVIVNSRKGIIVEENNASHSNILSIREIEILQNIDNGKSSKEIAICLSISLHTVNRHRQNIIAKLRVSNSIEAIKIAKGLRLI